MSLKNSTICAIATAPGTGAIATIRLSGSEALNITQKVFKSVSKKILAQQPQATLHYGQIVDGKDIVDDVLVAVFKNPHSFTGEDSAEITCHGSIYIQNRILKLLIKNGASMAKPGEFTQRAFMNGKMDLSQAEAVADLIASNSAAAHKLALHQMRGGFSKELTELRSELLEFGALVELELDFAEEDVEFADRAKLNNLAVKIEAHIDRLANSFQLGNAIKTGVPVAIVGETNVGKSTLLNTLLNEEKAIVSSIHGTTRDVIEDMINLQGINFRFTDTAGIRKTTDKIETLGIERTFKQIEKSKIVILLVDTRQRLERIEQSIRKIREHISDQKLLIIGNKSDQLTAAEMNAFMEIMPLEKDEEILMISAKFKTNIQKLETMLLKAAEISELNQENVIVTNLRHYEALVKAQDAIHRVTAGLNNGITGDFLAQDIRECMHYLGEITGQISTDDMLGYIFKNFCIGK